MLRAWNKAWCTELGVSNLQSIGTWRLGVREVTGGSKILKGKTDVQGKRCCIWFENEI